MEVGPFRTVPASQTESGQVELRLTEGGWEEFANVVFSESMLSLHQSEISRSGYQGCAVGRASGVQRTTADRL